MTQDKPAGGWGKGYYGKTDKIVGGRRVKVVPEKEKKKKKTISLVGVVSPQKKTNPYLSP
jgi:hypothetical protein